MTIATSVAQRDFFLHLPTPPERAGYPNGFFRWLDTTEGYTIWKSFERKALQMAQRRAYYSAMAIAQVIRWETALQDGTEFKLNNNWVPGLARLWMHNYQSDYPGFFQLRDNLGRNA